MPPRRSRRGPALGVAVCASLLAALSARSAGGLRAAVAVVARAPPPSSPQQWEAHQSSVDQQMAHFWKESSGHGISELEERAILGTTDAQLDKEADPSTYGEVTSFGCRQIGEALGLDVYDEAQQAIFMDLGSGLGKLVVQAYVEWPSVVRSEGVEMSSSRASLASAAWTSMLASGEAATLRGASHDLDGVVFDLTEDAASFVSLAEGDLMLHDIQDATHIYVSSLCFGPDFMRKIARKIAGEAPELRALVTLKPFPNGLPGFDHVDTFGARMSWSIGRGGCSAYLYKRSEEAS